MLSYILRRLLLMVPTFIGILLINFAVLRLQAPSLVEQMNAASATGGNELSDQTGGAKDIENYIDRFRRAGTDLPGIINFRGFYSPDDYANSLRKTIADGTYKNEPSARNRAEKDLWLSGPQAVLPLVEVLADDRHVQLHPLVIDALTYCAYISLTPRDFTRLPAEHVQRIQMRNEILRHQRIQYLNTREKGIEVRDAQAETKRNTLLALFRQPDVQSEYRALSGSPWSALFTKTGFVDFSSKLFTGELYSESRKEYVFTLIGERWQVTFWLSTISLILAWVVSLPLGIRSARRQGTLEDACVTNTLFLVWSIPSMFVGTLLLYHFCTDSADSRAWFPNRGLSSSDSLWLPTGAYVLDVLWHAFLPLIVLCYADFTILSRYMRANLIEQLQSDYVRTARAKGCAEDTVVYRHAARNSMITMITLGSGLLAGLFHGALVVELIFSVPGLGLLILEAAIERDAPLLMGSTVISVVLLLVGILIADLCYALADPRIRSRYV